MGLSQTAALVTGGASGIGRAVVELFAELGAHVVVADIDDDRGARIVCDLPTPGLFIKTDVSNRDEVAAAVGAAVDRFGGLDVVVNSAGLGAKYPSWEDVVRVNIQGVYYGCLHGVEAMRSGAGGVIISMSTAVAVYGAEEDADDVLKRALDEGVDDLAPLLAGIVGDSGAAYVLSKRMVNHMTRLFAVRTATEGIRVNAVAPGFVTTEGMGRPLTESDEARRRYESVMPMRRLAAPEEIARVIRFLVSDDASMMTGAIVAVDGGWSASKRI